MWRLGYSSLHPAVSSLHPAVSSLHRMVSRGPAVKVVEIQGQEM